MELGMIGLGRMGANMTERLTRGGHRVVGYDLKPESRARVEAIGAASAASLKSLVSKLAPFGTLQISGPIVKVHRLPAVEAQRELFGRQRV